MNDACGKLYVNYVKPPITGSMNIRYLLNNGSLIMQVNDRIMTEHYDRLHLTCMQVIMMTN